MLLFVPAASLGSAANVEIRSAVLTVQKAPPATPAPPPAPFAKFGLADEHDHGSGLAPGQTAQDFEAWVRRSPANMAEVGAFRDYLAAEGLEAVVPVWQLVRTSSSWKQCGAQPFEVPPPDKWERIVKTLKFVRDDVVPRSAEKRAPRVLRARPHAGERGPRPDRDDSVGLRRSCSRWPGL
jgi:hypothetical protein